MNLDLVGSNQVNSDTIYQQETSEQGFGSVWFE